MIVAQLIVYQINVEWSGVVTAVRANAYGFVTTQAKSEDVRSIPGEVQDLRLGDANNALW